MKDVEQRLTRAREEVTHCEDYDYLVINKPSGLLTHPTMARESMSVASVLAKKYPEIKKVGDDPETRPGIVHRLDKEASGLLVVARTQKMFGCLKEQFKNDKEGLAKAMMELYKTEKVNPMSSCLPLLIQLPILWALYRVLCDGMNTDSLVNLYPFVQHPETINLNFLGFINLSEPYLVMAIIAGILQFVQTKMLIAKRPPKKLRKEPGAKDEDMLANMNQSMMYFMPVMTVVIGASLPGGLTLYWIIMNVFAILQQALTFKKKKEEKVEVVKV